MSAPSPDVYVALLAATWALHFAGAAYVLGGCGWLVARALRGATEREPVERVVRDWLPFVLSVTITAGVAPLLFVQVLHGTAFYTANLLLFGRWMAILPVLIVGFYLLYVLKSEADLRRGRGSRIALPSATLACFALVGLAWTENHLLSLAGQEAWVARYGRSSLWPSAATLPRLAAWFGLAVPVFATAVAWQLARRPASCRDEPTERVADAAHRLALPSLAGLATFVLAGGAHLLARGLPDAGPARTLALFGLGAVLLGGALQALGWSRARRESAPRPWLAAGAVLLLGGAAALREGLRLATLDLAAWRARVQGVATGEGFALFLVLAALLVAATVWIVRATAPARS